MQGWILFMRHSCLLLTCFSDLKKQLWNGLMVIGLLGWAPTKDLYQAAGTPQHRCMSDLGYLSILYGDKYVKNMFSGILNSS